MDKLDEIFDLQKKFDTELVLRRGLEGIDQTTWIQKEVLAIISELGELLDEVNFKWWKNPKPVDREAVKEELVDVLHFFVSMCLKIDLSADELYTAYVEKNKENFRRQHGTSEKEGYAFPLTASK